MIEEMHDVFKYKRPDTYFGDDCGDDWNSTPVDWNMNPNFQQGVGNNISLNGSAYRPPAFYVF